MLVNKLINKSSVTYFIAIVFIVASYAVNIQPYNHILANIGYFSLTSSVTNWLAIYMLFEKIPFLAGSGVILARFEAFKEGLKLLIMSEFFTEDNITAVLEQITLDQEKLLEIANRIDYDKLSQQLIDGLMETKLGSMLALVGGQSIIGLIKEPLKEKLHRAFLEVLAQEELQNALLEVVAHHHSHFIETIEQIVDHHLDKLTPLVVKEIIQKMIREHLGWLVVWGGIFGGLIGALTSFILK